MFVILDWRGLLIIPRNDFVPSETLGTLTDWTGALYFTSIRNLSSPYLGLLSWRRRGVNTSLLFCRKGFSRPVMYYSNSNAIFQPELLIICVDVSVNPGPVIKRNQGRSTAQNAQFVRKLLLKLKDALSVGCVMIWRMSKVKVLRLILLAYSPVSWTCAFASLPFFEESSCDDSNALTFSSDESSLMYS